MHLSFVWYSLVNKMYLSFVWYWLVNKMYLSFVWYWLVKVNEIVHHFFPKQKSLGSFRPLTELSVTFYKLPLVDGNVLRSSVQVHLAQFHVWAGPGFIVKQTNYFHDTVNPFITNTSKEFIKCRILHFLIMECCRYLVF